MVSAGLVISAGSLHDLYTAAFLLRPYTVERSSDISSFSFFLKVYQCYPGGCTLVIVSKSNYLQRALPTNTITRRVRASK